MEGLPSERHCWPHASSFFSLLCRKGCILMCDRHWSPFPNWEEFIYYKTISRGFPLFFFSLLTSLVAVSEQWIWKRDLSTPPQHLHVLSRDLCSDLLSNKGKRSTLCERSRCGAVPELRNKAHLIPGEALAMPSDYRPRPPSPNNKGRIILYTPPWLLGLSNCF